MPRTLPALLKSRGFLLAGYLLLAWIASIQQWSLKRPGDPYTHYNNYVIFRQAFFHLVGHQELYTQYLAEHWDYFRYSPSFALAFGAFAWMPDLVGLLLWNTLNVGVLFLGWMALPVRDDRVRLAAAWFAAVEVMTALQNAQSNVLIAGLLLLAFSFLERRRMAMASLMIVTAAFIKPFGLVAFSLFLFYPEKKRFILFAALWGGVVALVPLIVVAPAELMRLYTGWWSLLSMDYADSAGLSVMGWLQSWFHLTPPKAIVTLVGMALFCWPLTRVERYRDLTFRLLFLCNVLIWVVIFNHKAESSTYAIAICGVAVWYFLRPRSGLDFALVSLAFVFTCLSPTDVFPSSLSAALFVPYTIKAVPCIVIWGRIIYELNGLRIESPMKQILGSALVVLAWSCCPSTAAAQQPPGGRPTTRNLLADMQSYAQALGVTCEYCHVAPVNSGLPQPKKDIARTMIAMTRDLNTQVQLATGKAPVEATRVECATCHRGVITPRPLGQVIAQTLQYKGADAAVVQYRDLRARYYGRGSYDFGEDELVNVARPMASVRPDDAITLLELNIEFNPRSAKSYALMGFAYTRKFDDESAIANVQKAVDLEPENGEFQGQLAQLKMFQRKR